MDHPQQTEHRISNAIGQGELSIEAFPGRPKCLHCSHLGDPEHVQHPGVCIDNIIYGANISPRFCRPVKKEQAKIEYVAVTGIYHLNATNTKMAVIEAYALLGSTMMSLFQDFPWTQRF